METPRFDPAELALRHAQLGRGEVFESNDAAGARTIFFASIAGKALKSPDSGKEMETF